MVSEDLGKREPMSRRRAREMALQAMFHLDYNQIDKETILFSVFFENQDASENAKEYAKLLFNGTIEHVEEIDSVLSGISNDWKIDRMTGVDRNIARIAVFELKFGEEDILPNIIINEALEIAKVYGTEQSSRFLNGILGALIKDKT